MRRVICPNCGSYWVYPGYGNISWGKLKRQILLRNHYQCQKCGVKGKLAVHHIRPLAHGGTSDPENLITLCDECHR